MELSAATVSKRPASFILPGEKNQTVYNYLAIFEQYHKQRLTPTVPVEKCNGAFVLGLPWKFPTSLPFTPANS